MPFVGRAVESERFLAAARDAAEGRPWLVTIEGPAGSGKSALLRACLDVLGDEYLIERAYGDDLAVDVPMALLGQVTRATDDAPFAAALQLIDHLADLQQGGKVAVLAVEDLHWADRPSVQALVTAMRRLDHDRVLVVVTIREDSAPRDERWGRLRADPDRCRPIVVPPLTGQECAELASAAGTALPPEAADRLARHTAGNALYIRTLLDELTPSQLTRPGPDLPVPRSLSAIINAQVAGLAPEAAAVCEALAVLGGRASVPVVEAVAGVPSALAVLDGSGASSLVDVSTTPGRTALAFVHPLQELAVYEDLAPGRRTALHTAAAHVLPADEALRHRALAADPADTSLEHDLLVAAEAARAAGHGALAARHLLWAGEITSSPATRRRRALEASLALIDAGELSAAHDRCPTSVADDDQQLHCLVRGMLAAASGDMLAGEQLLKRSATGADPSLAATALVQLGYLFTALSQGVDAVDAVAPVASLVGADSEQAGVADVLHAIGVSQQWGAEAGLADLVARFPEERPLAPSLGALVVGTRGMFEAYAGRQRAAVSDLHAFIERSQQGLQTVHLARAETLLAFALLARGAWDEAAVHARTAIDLAGDEGLALVLAQAEAVAAMALAPGAASDSASGYVERARRAADGAGTAEADVWARLAAAALAEATSRPDEVVALLEPLEGGPRDEAGPVFATLWLPRLTGAFLDLGRTAEARRRIDLLATLARRRSGELTVVVATMEARRTALDGDAAAALAAFERAQSAVTSDTAVLERFHLHRHHGAQLLAVGRLEEARTQLHAAERLVAPLGPGPLVEHIRADLNAAGAELDLPTDDLAAGLTERERDVVALVRQGYTNREVAETLFVSVKAVEYHMGNIFSKLGIRSRRELRAPRG
ncbi:MAG: AAA family ATPase [Acidimicrobiales bacterium]|nr:AAA family ATPase [Acidimicrobiales bacterium]